MARRRKGPSKKDEQKTVSSGPAAAVRRLHERFTDLQKTHHTVAAEQALTALLQGDPGARDMAFKNHGISEGLGRAARSLDEVMHEHGIVDPYMIGN